MNQENTENIEKEIIENESTSEQTQENIEIPVVELTNEEKLQEDLAKEKDKFLRLFAEFENFKKRTAKERIDLIKTASEEVLKDLIPVVDDFERSIKASDNETDAVKIKEGNQLIYHKLIRTLESKGLKSMEDLIGKPFDPDTQEAITQIPAPSDQLKGSVIDVVEKGYILGEKVVRFAKVVTGA